MTPDTNPQGVVEEYIEAYNERDSERIEAILANEIDSEDTAYERDELVDAIKTYWNAFPDCHHTVDRYVLADDFVTVRTRFSGTHEAEYYDLSASKESFDVTEMMMFRVSDGEINGYWYAWDEIGFWTQLGFIDHPLQ